MKWIREIGPGILIAAAFIGPGTVTLCTIAGINFGYALLWTMTLSILATIILQEMSSRLGVVTQRGLSETIRAEIKSPVIRNTVIILILSAIVIGNAAYEAGNISGGALGVKTLFGTLEFQIFSRSIDIWPIVIGFIAFVVLYIGNYKIIERALVSMVILMSLAFLFTAVITKPNIFEVLEGMFIPQLPEKSILTVIGLIGTTVVPYNIFLHASLAKTKWKSETDLSFARKDTVIAVVLGGIVSMCIIISASAEVLSSIFLTFILPLSFAFKIESIKELVEVPNGISWIIKVLASCFLIFPLTRTRPPLLPSL